MGDDASVFQQTLQNVQRLDVSVSVGPTNAHVTEIGAVYLSQVPAATLIASAPGNTQITWSPLQTDVTYNVEAATSVDGVWSPTNTFSPTGTTHTVGLNADTNGPAQIFFRLR